MVMLDGFPRMDFQHRPLIIPIRARCDMSRDGFFALLYFINEERAMTRTAHDKPAQQAHSTPEPDMPPPKPEKDPPPDNMPLPEQAPIEEPTPPQPPIKT